MGGEKSEAEYSFGVWFVKRMRFEIVVFKCDVLTSNRC